MTVAEAADELGDDELAGRLREFVRILTSNNKRLTLKQSFTPRKATGKGRAAAVAAALMGLGSMLLARDGVE